MDRRLLPVMAAMILSLVPAATRAQSEPTRFEVGAHYTWLNAKVTPAGPDSRRGESGFGGWLSFNANRFLALEGEVNHFPEDFPSTFADPATRFVKPDTQVLFGAKAGVRFSKFGVFGKVRPGFVHYSPLEDCSTNEFSSCRDVRKNSWALDVGGVVEGYLSRHALIRFDVGSTTLHYPDTRYFFVLGPQSAVLTRSGMTSQNLQVSVGAAFRF